MTTLDDVNASITLDKYYLPVEAGVRFTAAMPNPNFTTEFITLRDDTLMEVGQRAQGRPERILTRERFIVAGHHSSYELDAVRERIKRSFPDRRQLRMLPHEEQYPLLDAIVEHLNTADGMAHAEQKLTERGEADKLTEDTTWLVPDRNGPGAQAVHCFDLWDCGWMPIWDQDEPSWPHEQ